jgi:hypothetical protein
MQARKLKSLIGKVRENYERDWSSSDLAKRQVGSSDGGGCGHQQLAAWS